MTAVIRAKHYDERVAELMADPIIQGMADQVPLDIDLDTHERMMGALNEYRLRGGKISSHIGGPIEAITKLRDRRKPGLTDLGRGWVRRVDAATGEVEIIARAKLDPSGDIRPCGMTVVIERASGERHCVKLPEGVGFLLSGIIEAAEAKHASVFIDGVGWIGTGNVPRSASNLYRVILGADKGALVRL